jgi:predicted ATPase
MIHSIKLDNLLSFPSGTPALELKNLNVLIGTNGSGKSNLIEALALMRTTPRTPSNDDFQRVISRGGSISEWIWKGEPEHPATIELVIDNPYTKPLNHKQPLRHSVTIKGDQQRVIFIDESIENKDPYPDHPKDTYFYYRFYKGTPVLNTAIDGKRKLNVDSVSSELSILALLCDPDPPKLLCIEEPELGLHPDILPKLADLLIEASHRTQIIVTTHSDILVDSMTETPESVVVCEKQDGKTSMTRLDKAELSVWLDKYRSGQLWTRGEIGGARW